MRHVEISGEKRRGFLGSLVIARRVIGMVLLETSLAYGLTLIVLVRVA